ncbi:TetR/AcrR family transcriptional regulator [Mycobacterium bourgelatii]|uniref:Transcriptional regulator n=1 Tax=Mycobacterium bourgelatii TaxID=1273442 RepID=A0A7I9YPN9_MYCBU|nr:TetR/AcrR family transcriptional regulator [Mycobacterium bourgelatii]MCV6973744.1 TetR/AcrR family transcriptional regulator [Mycobacterium bourgelatii]GFG90644.1 transcriptional regulator [Mycobacterium bourgelatii]
MSTNDWLVDGDRHAVAVERIYDAASDMIAEHGFNSLNIDKLCQKVHCSRATIYRYVGGKNEIRNVVLARAAARIADAVREELEHLSGRERLVSSIILSLQKVRCDPVGKVMIASIRGGTGEVAWLAKSPLLADVATELAGLAGGDPQAAEWVVRVVLSLMFWPGQDEDAERQLVERFVAPAFEQSQRAADQSVGAVSPT